MKKFIAAFFAAVITFCFGMAILSGCSLQKDDGKISVVCTIFPEYDWVKNVAGENDDVEISFLLDDGVDLHSYQPTADDIVSVSSCDMFVCVGGESDEWVWDVLRQNTNDDMIVINLLDVLGDKVKEEEIVDGMEPEEDEEDEEETEYDEHVWLSLKNARIIVSHIAAKLGEIDGENAAAYTSNADDYNAKLSSLDLEYEEAVSAAKFNTLVFGDRFPFRYLTDDYSLSYYAAFSGCSAESEASFETIIFLANKVDELGLGCILKIEGDNNKIAETVKNNTSSKNQTVLTLNSLQSTTAKDAEDGVTYLSVMTENLETLKTALN